MMMMIVMHMLNAILFQTLYCHYDGEHDFQTALFKCWYVAYWCARGLYLLISCSLVCCHLSLCSLTVIKSCVVALTLLIGVKAVIAPL